MLTLCEASNAENAAIQRKQTQCRGGMTAGLRGKSGCCERTYEQLAAPGVQNDRPEKRCRLATLAARGARKMPRKIVAWSRRFLREAGRRIASRSTFGRKLAGFRPGGSQVSRGSARTLDCRIRRWRSFVRCRDAGNAPPRAIGQNREFAVCDTRAQ